LSSKSKIKGTRVERDIVKLFESIGFSARRQPMSGAIQDFPHDVYVNDLFDGTTIEVKARKNGAGFAQLDNWKGGADILILKKDFENPNVYVEWKFFKELLDVYRQHRFGSESREQEDISNKLGRKTSSEKNSTKGTFKIPSRKFDQQQGVRQADRKSWALDQRKTYQKAHRQSLKDARAKLQASWRGTKDISQM
jgi:Holliday junction resolvase